MFTQKSKHVSYCGLLDSCLAASDGKTFFINRKQHQHDRIDTEVKLSDVEEWTVHNVTGERHVFHIHQLDFLVKEINHDDHDSTGLRDTIDAPYQIDGVPAHRSVYQPEYCWQICLSLPYSGTCG